ncbi:unnamed protein product [Polarella glacialis]|uniref:CRAL-TRIO domain-containing protein n=2 Tax=Polarella glacialis TaxID=89957 RepID=A0A813LB62_POLGL|nr:unnamed protein product [Polarella glacialis]CAE8720492.1 unnamed protein product [Polarella glacialis]
MASEASAERLDQLRRRLAATPGLPLWRGRSQATEEDGLLWWFLRDRRMDISESAQKLARCLQWRQDFRVDKLGPELFHKELRLRKAYLHESLDLAGRPVLVAVARRHNVLDRRLHESCQMCAWFMEQALDRLAMEGPEAQAQTQEGQRKAEQALGIFDVRDFSPLNIDPDFVSFLIDALYNYYPSRVSRVLFVGAPELFRGFWATAVRPLLGRYAALADFVSVEEVRDQYFAPGKAPPDFQSDFHFE